MAGGWRSNAMVDRYGIKVHPHQLRHSWAHAAQVKAWARTTYASSRATERSLAAQNRLDPGDDL